MESIISSKKDEEKFILFLLYFFHDWVITNNIDRRYITELKIQKIFFNIIEELNIPVTRSWYLYGVYVHSGLINKDIAYDVNFLYPNLEFTEFNKIRQKTNFLMDVYCKQILFKNQKEFLKEFYQKAPQLFKELYLNNLNLRQSMRNLINYLITQKVLISHLK